jgi:hypothetical protein
MIVGRGPIVIIFLGCLFGSIYLIPRKIHHVPYEYKLLGQWMRNNLPDIRQSIVMSHRMGVPFYAGSYHVQTFPGSYQEILEYARKSGADYLMVNDWTTPRLRPALTFLLDGREPAETLQKIHTVTYCGRRAILFKFK